MFRTNNYSSSGGVLYKQLTVFHLRLKKSLVAGTIRIIISTLKNLEYLALSFQRWCDMRV